MNKTSLSERIITQSFYLSVWLINKIAGTKQAVQKETILNNLSEGTIGKEIANCLKQHDLNLVPYFESHDLKHVLLNYKMTALDEIRLQAFMLGNGNWSLPSLAIW